MIKHWNDRVAPDDTVYYLGDFQMQADPDKYLPRLNGTKILIAGNHDYERMPIVESPHWASVHDILIINHMNVNITLCHYAMRVWRHSYRPSSFMLYGHSHARLAGSSQSCDVGVDAWNYRPVQWREIQQRLQKYGEYVDPSFRTQQPDTPA